MIDTASEVLVGLLLFVVVLLLVGTTILIAWRRSRPHSKRMAKEKEHIDLKAGDTKDAAKEEAFEKRHGFWKQYWKTIVYGLIGLGVVALIAFVFFGVIEVRSLVPNTDLTHLVVWLRKYTVLLLIIAAILAILSYPTSLKGYSTLFGRAAYTLVGLCLLLWIAPSLIEFFSPPPFCRYLSVLERRCHLTTEWSNWTKIDPAEGSDDNGLLVWRSEGTIEEHKMLDGTMFYRYRVADGEMDMCYVLAGAKPALSC